MSSSTKIVNRKKNILILGKGPIQGLEHKLSAENSIQLILQCIIKSYVLMEQIVIYLLNVNSTEIHKFKVKDSEIVATLLHLRNISKDWSVDNMEKKNRIKWICL